MREMSQNGSVKNMEVSSPAAVVGDVAKTALKNLVARKLLPWPDVYGLEFWNVAREKGLTEIMGEHGGEFILSREAIEAFLSDTGQVLDGIRDTVDDFVTGTKNHVEGISTTLEDMRQDRAKDNSLLVRIGQLIAHNQALKAHTARAEERLREQTVLIKELQDKLRIDPLTGLYNRRALEKDLDREINRAFRYRFPLSVLMADLDHFKKVNDTYGHQVGDKVLQSLASIFRDTVRDVDLLYRYGGEEFVIILPHTCCEDAITLAERLKVRVQQHVFTVRRQGITIHQTISLGCAELLVGESKENLLFRTDRALYRAKGNGRNRVEAACGPESMQEGDAVN